ncbi:MAG TPA: dehydratase [Actinobacteria bacterium]|nr:dehydratase [Actinomycetota bacterium]
MEPLEKSASRADLVRYAGASHDWNPIHWDHASAVAVGLEGVIVHGLLAAAWVTQAVARYVPGERPIVDARFRFRSPLRPGVETRVVGEVIDDAAGRFRAALQSETGTHVTADLAVTR